VRVSVFDNTTTHSNAYWRFVRSLFSLVFFVSSMTQWFASLLFILGYIGLVLPASPRVIEALLGADLLWLVVGYQFSIQFVPKVLCFLRRAESNYLIFFFGLEKSGPFRPIFSCT